MRIGSYFHEKKIELEELMILWMTKQGAGMRVCQHLNKNLPREALIIMGKREPFVFSEKRAILLRNSFLSLKQGSLTAEKRINNKN